ncbi:hypothetical protein HOU02_gp073 [Caulobacter phage CcrBL9]|uniref:Uncharacterized protein n=1 Tax=Caulobacter phage CcrBL9 TaxID=2283270 RepID=A0A385EE47_9CAUD|nr:hypothetical protein HOU02_gp073 [Caulobacter phage CcrBL9]AXQ69097.1 hypothetical protein CcrBL9_gp073c [Caulobacter phage CcrBL9]
MTIEAKTIDLEVNFVDSTRLSMGTVWSKGWPTMHALTIKGGDYLVIPVRIEGDLGAEAVKIEPGVYRVKVLNVIKHVDGGLNIPEPFLSHVQVLVQVIERRPPPEPF